MQRMRHHPEPFIDPTARLDVRHEPLTIHVAGEIDVASAGEFDLVLDRCERDPLVRTLDLSDVGFFSAAGVRCLVARAWPRCPHPAIVASPSVRKVLEVCNLEFLLTPHGRRPALVGWSSPPQLGA